MLRAITLTSVLCLTGLPATAADYSDPTWPCVQRKVADLSLGLMWHLPTDAPAAALDPELQEEIGAMAETLSLRRIELEDLRLEVTEFVARHDADPQVMTAVFADVFARLNKRRARILNGIGDFSLSQIALADKIGDADAEMTAELAREAPDYDRVDALEEQLDWDQLIYSDRQQSIQYLCETPVIIERRLFGIAQMLQQVMSE